MESFITEDNQLQQFNNEHRHSLHLCWKIRKGIEKEVDYKRIKKYVDWFYKNHLSPLLDAEEKFLFPLLDKDNRITKKALSNHRRLRRLFNKKDNLERTLNQIEEELEHHIRFEEKEVFTMLLEEIEPNQLQTILKKHHSIRFFENKEDEFWLED